MVPFCLNRYHIMLNKVTCLFWIYKEGSKGFESLPYKPKAFRQMYLLCKNHDCYDLNLTCWCSAALCIKDKEGTVVLFRCDSKVIVSDAVSLTV